MVRKIKSRSAKETTASFFKSSKSLLYLVLLLAVITITFLQIAHTQNFRQQASGASLPPLPTNWPNTMQIGLSDSPGGASAMKAKAPFGFRYQYLSGGVNTGSGWTTWNSPAGAFATNYIQESVAAGITPVFSYYQIFQSKPGGSSEATTDLSNMNNVSTMTSYFNEIKLFMQKAGAFPTTPVVLHVEPDLWGYLEQNATNNDASTIPAQVASTGLAELAGLPNNASGFAQAIIKLRNTYAPNVIVAYHLSIWGTGTDIQTSKPSDVVVNSLATQAGSFYLSLKTQFDIVFTDGLDRDAAFYQLVYGDGGLRWMSPTDYVRNTLFIQQFVATTQKRIVMWQIPFGNTKFLAENNTWEHYQDNHVETILGESGYTDLNNYMNAGVVAFLFGRGADGPTNNSDTANDGTTNPAAITTSHNGVTTTTSLTSLSSDDDGGYFNQQVAGYYKSGALLLPVSGVQLTPTPTPIPNVTPTSTPIPTIPPPTAIPTTVPGDVIAPNVTITNPLNGALLTRSIRITISATATDNVGISKVEFYVNGTRICTDSRAAYSCSWRVPSSRGTTYTLTAKAYDRSNNTNTSTITVTSK